MLWLPWTRTRSDAEQASDPLLESMSDDEDVQEQIAEMQADPPKKAQYGIHMLEKEAQLLKEIEDDRRDEGDGDGRPSAADAAPSASSDTIASDSPVTLSQILHECAMSTLHFLFV